MIKIFFFSSYLLYHPKSHENLPRNVNHQLKIGMNKSQYYGVAMAKLCNFPTSAMERAEEISNELISNEQVSIPLHINATMAKLHSFLINIILAVIHLAR